MGQSSLDKVVSIVGCLCCIPLSFVYPALFHAQLTQSKIVKFKDWVLVIMGILATIYTSAIVIQQWSVGPTIPKNRCE